MNDKEKIIDVSYTEDDIKVITNELDKNKVYYTVGQVAKMLNIRESKLRYWSNFFAADDEGKDLIKIEYSNKNRAYTLDNINKLKRMKELIEEDGMTLQQAKDFTSTHGFDANNKAIESDNPLALQAFVRELTSEIDNKLKSFENNLLEKVVMAMEEKNLQMIRDEEKRNQVLKQEIAILTSETVSDGINKVVKDKLDEVSIDISNKIEEQSNNQETFKEDISNKINEYSKLQDEKLDKFLSIQQEESQRQIKQYEDLRQRMDDRKENYEETKRLEQVSLKARFKNMLGIK